MRLPDGVTIANLDGDTANAQKSAPARFATAAASSSNELPRSTLPLGCIAASPANDRPV